jgi:hypothetical protein
LTIKKSVKIYPIRVILVLEGAKAILHGKYSMVSLGMRKCGMQPSKTGGALLFHTGDRYEKE